MFKLPLNESASEAVLVEAEILAIQSKMTICALTIIFVISGNAKTTPMSGRIHRSFIKIDH